MRWKHRKGARVLGVALIALAGGFYGQAEAVCEQADLTGTWHATGVYGNSNYDGFEEYIRCKFVFVSTGAIVASSSTCRGRDNVGLFTITVTGGTLRLSTACAVTGSITFYAGTSLRHIVEFGQVAREKDIFTFTSYQATNPDILTVFTAVKQ